ncbi:hypothetical protein STEG23_004904, partial [Scotinomys teguina]
MGRHQGEERCQPAMKKTRCRSYRCWMQAKQSSQRTPLDCTSPLPDPVIYPFVTYLRRQSQEDLYEFQASLAYSEFQDSLAYCEFQDSQGYSEFQASLAYSEFQASLAYSEFQASLGYSEFQDSLGYSEFQDSLGYPGQPGLHEFQDSQGYSEFQDSQGYSEFQASLAYSEFQDSLAYCEFQDSQGYSEFQASLAYSEFQASLAYSEFQDSLGYSSRTARAEFQDSLACEFQQPGLQVMVTSVPKLQPIAMSGSLTLLQPESVLMSMACATAKGHADIKKKDMELDGVHHITLCDFAEASILNTQLAHFAPRMSCHHIMLCQEMLPKTPWIQIWIIGRCE